MPHVTSTESEYLDAHNCLKVLEGDLGSGVARDGTLHHVGALLEDLRAQKETQLWPDDGCRGEEEVGRRVGDDKGASEVNPMCMDTARDINAVLYHREAWRHCP
jgi:hypothetical protein